MQQKSLKNIDFFFILFENLNLLKNIIYSLLSKTGRSLKTYRGYILLYMQVFAELKINANSMPQ